MVNRWCKRRCSIAGDPGGGQRAGVGSWESKKCRTLTNLLCSYTYSDGSVDVRAD